jgi:Xaa-Pro aminopeptidase
MDEDLRKERLRHPISKGELERRWRAVREAMSKAGLDCLVMQNNNQHLGGYVRYFTDIPAEHGYPKTVIFPLDGEMTLISHGGPPLLPSPPEWALHGVKERVNLPYLPTLNFTNTMEGEAALKVLRSRKMKSVGFVAKASMAATFYEVLKENLPGVSTQDATNLVDEIKAVKSEEEIAAIRETIKLQDTVFGALLAMLRPGVREYEIRSEIKRLCINLGSEEQLIAVSSAPAGTPAGNKGAFFQTRALQPGDQVMIMLEVNGPGGLYGELARTVCIGDAPKPLLDSWNNAVKAQDQTAERMKPNVTPKELFDAHNELISSMGYPMEGRLFAHAQGYDLVERPGIRPEEAMPIKANMNMAIHPILLSKEAYAFCCDNYLVTGAGCIRLHETPRNVFVV